MAELNTRPVPVPFNPQRDGIDGSVGFRKLTAKRRNVTRACDSCRAKKRRCTGDQPCGACRPYGSQCTYNATYSRGRVPQTLPSQQISHGYQTPQAAPSSNTGLLAASTSSLSHVDPEAARAESPDYDTLDVTGQYVGRTSAHSFLQRAWKRFGKGVLDQRLSDYGESIQNTSVLAYGDRHVPHSDYAQVELPEQATTMALVSTYFDFAMPTYRFLHEPTICSWLSKYTQHSVSATPESLEISPAKQVIVLLVLATALLYQKDAPHAEVRTIKNATQEAEKFFQVAQQKLREEKGRPNLESVQARLAASLYLNSTSRPTQAWYLLGTVSQLIISCGLHRREHSRDKSSDYVTRECRKRVFWTAYIIDMYLSVLFGRPPLIQDDYVDQDLPESLDDEDLTLDARTPRNDARDSVTKASVLHAQLASIVKQAAQQQQRLQRSRKLDNLMYLNSKLEAWRNALPVILSGAIHPSSLLPVFRRQYAVLSLAYSHAVILVNRTLLLGGYKKPTNSQRHIEICMMAAKSALDSTLSSMSERRMFASYWFTQYIAFTALSVTYVWLIQRKQGRVPRIAALEESDLFKHADTVQCQLTELNKHNAPSLRYGVVLDGLREEAHRMVTRPDPQPVQQQDTNIASGVDTATVPTITATDLDWDTLDSDFAFDPELWHQLDTFPFGAELDNHDLPGAIYGQN